MPEKIKFNLDEAKKFCLEKKLTKKRDQLFIPNDAIDKSRFQIQNLILPNCTDAEGKLKYKHKINDYVWDENTTLLDFYLNQHNMRINGGKNIRRKTSKNSHRKSSKKHRKSRRRRR